MRNGAPISLLALAALALALTPISCGRQLKATPEIPKIDGRDAYFITDGATDFGPRPPGSKGSSRQLDWIAAEARVAGAKSVKLQQFVENTPEGRVKFSNLVVDVQGASDRFLAIGVHHDTKKLSAFPDFVGANDGGSGVGLAIQLIKTICLKKTVPPHSLKFVFFDGEECFLEYSDNDGLYGSRRIAKAWAADGTLKNCDGVIVLDMVGDADLKIEFPSDSDPQFVEIALKAAAELGWQDNFVLSDKAVLDDHKPFQRLGVPAIDFIDFEYGPENRYWHTSADTMDKLAGESFTKVGQVVLNLIWLAPFR